MSKIKIKYHWLPCLYATYYPMLKRIARYHGYSLALHGSLKRDMDLVAIPWIEKPKPPFKLLKAFRKAIGIERSDNQAYDSTTKKPHNRVSYTMQMGGGGYMDISIIEPKGLWDK